MITYNKAKQIILEKYPDSNIDAAYKLPAGYLFSMIPMNWPEGECVLGNFFKVTNDSQIEEYSPVMELEEFGEALNNRIE